MYDGRSGPSDTPWSMPERPDDDGLPDFVLFASAWLLAVASLVAWLYLAQHLDGPGAWDSHAVLALAVAVSGSVFSACCAMIIAIKSSEARLRRSDAVRLDNRSAQQQNALSSRCPWSRTCRRADVGVSPSGSGARRHRRRCVAP